MSADGWSATLRGLGSHAGTEADFAILESDDELRARLIYVAGEGAAAIERISRAKGARLDEIAESCGLRRRKS